MGISASCLRVIPCAGGGAGESNGAAVADQTKSSKAKKGWSFKKRSSSAQAVSSSVIVETPSPVHKENIQSAAVNFETANESVASEKDSVPQWDEKKPPPAASADLYVNEVVPAAENERNLAVADSYSTVAVSDPETEKSPAAADSYVPDAVTICKAESEKQPDVEDLCVTDSSTLSKTENFEVVVAVNEKDVIIIQSAVRAFLAQRERIKHKSVVKLQAVVRGHLVRCQAIGALKCVQAIAKMQLLVRARYASRATRKDCKSPESKPEITYTSMTELLKNSFARQLLESSAKSRPIKIKCDPLSRDSSWVWLERWMSLASPVAVDDITTSIEKGQEGKNIENEADGKVTEKKQEQEEKIIVEDYLFQEENEIFLDAKDSLNSANSAEYSKMDIVEEAKLVNSGEITNHDEDSLSPSSTKMETLDSLDEADVVQAAAKISENQLDDASGNSQCEITCVDETFDLKAEQALGNEEAVEQKAEVEAEQVAHIGTGDENIVSGSGKEPDNLRYSEPHEMVSFPIATILSDQVPLHDRVEESLANSADLKDGPIQLEAEVEEQRNAPNSVNECIYVPKIAEAEELASHGSDTDLIAESPTSSEDDILINHEEIAQPDQSSIRVGESECGTKIAEAEELASHGSDTDLIAESATSSEDDILINHEEIVQPDQSSIRVGESECGTELSITSTLDSPDRLEIEPMAAELEMVSADAESRIVDSKSNIVETESETESALLEIEKSDAVNGEAAAAAAAEKTTIANTDVEDKELETNGPNAHSRLEAGDEEMLKPSPTVSYLPAKSEGSIERNHQASPGTQMTQVTFSESQGTPSSEVSVSTKPKRTTKSEKSGSIKKRTLLSAVKKSPIDSSGKISVEEQMKSQKSAKRRTSFGSPKPDPTDQEQRRDSSTSSSLPSYMQATESARAKANAGISPRSSPDVTDNNDVFLRKRHSLSKDKQDSHSPRLRRTSSQAQSGSKSNGNSPLERKWQR